jgi:hypothetical protein
MSTTGFVVPDPEPAADPAQSQPAPAEGGTAQDRINQLIKQSTEQDTQLQAAQAQNTTLLAKINELSQKVDGLQQPAGASAADDPIAQLLTEAAPAGSKAKQLSPEDTAKLISATVQQAIKPLVERAQAADEQTALAASQHSSFQRAVAQSPKLADPNTPLGAAFTQIWDGRPDLQGLEDGPALAAAIAQGVLVADTQAAVTTEQRKVAATVTRPNTAGPTAEALKQTTDAAKAAELGAQLAEKGAIRGHTGEEEIQLLELALRQQGGG